MIAITDECQLANGSENDMESHDPIAQIETKTMNILYPTISFNANYFLRTFYPISNIPQFYEWLHNHRDAPTFTLIRMLDCFIMAYGHRVSIVDEIFIDCLIDVINGFWMKSIYLNLHKFIGVKDDKCFITSPTKNKLDIRDHSKLRKKFIMTDIFTKQTLMDHTTSFFAHFPDIPYGTDDLLIFIIKKILDTMPK